MYDVKVLDWSLYITVDPFEMSSTEIRERIAWFLRIEKGYDVEPDWVQFKTKWVPEWQTHIAVSKQQIRVPVYTGEARFV